MTPAQVYYISGAHRQRAAAARPAAAPGIAGATPGTLADLQAFASTPLG